MRPKAQAIANGMTQQQVDLEDVAERRRVLERVRRVDVVEAAAVGPDLLDGLLARDRAAGELLGAVGERAHLARSTAKFCTTPSTTRTTAATTAIGSRTRTTPRTRSLKKLPIRHSPLRCAPALGRTRRRPPCRPRPTRSSARSARTSASGGRARPRRSTTASWCWSRSSRRCSRSRRPGAPGSPATGAGAAGGGRSRRGRGPRRGRSRARTVRSCASAGPRRGRSGAPGTSPARRPGAAGWCTRARGSGPAAGR